MINIPKVRIGLTTSDVILEQIILCKVIVKSIEKYATFRKEREVKDEIRRRLRICHDFLGMAGSRKYGCLYKEPGVTNKFVCDHSIPVSALVDFYKEKIPFEELIFYPVARISKESDMKFNLKGSSLVKSGHDINFPLIRYFKAGINIVTYEDKSVDCQKWTMEDHWRLLAKTESLTNIRNEVQEKIKGLYKLELA